MIDLQRRAKLNRQHTIHTRDHLKKILLSFPQNQRKEVLAILMPRLEMKLKAAARRTLDKK